METGLTRFATCNRVLVLMSVSTQVALASATVTPCDKCHSSSKFRLRLSANVSSSFLVLQRHAANGTMASLSCSGVLQPEVR